MDVPSKEELKKVAFAFLQQQTTTVISTVSPEITPEAASVSYVMDADWNIYIITHRDSRKVANIQVNPHVALVVGTSLVAHTAQIEGEAQIITELQPEFTMVTKLFESNSALNRDPILHSFRDNYVVLKITITWLRWLYFDQMTNKEVYTQLIP